MVRALENVIHVSFNVKEGEGIELSEMYKVGNTYPVFILLSGNGDIIYRWTGYTGTQPFISSLNKALSDLTTVKERIAEFDANPTYNAALMLARYFQDTGEYADALTYFREADKLKPSESIDLSFDIFSNSANAAWSDMIPFDAVLPVADSTLNGHGKNITIRVAQAMSRLTRKLDKEDYVKKYLQAGLDATAGAMDTKNKDIHASLQMEYALQVENDTAKAIRLKKENMGADWSKKPGEFYNFAKWCLERKVNLAEAETLTRTALRYAQGAEFKAQVLHTAAEICFAQDKLEDAVNLINQAIEQDPGNTIYMDAQELYLENWEKQFK